jgi:hypothetical protein
VRPYHKKKKKKWAGRVAQGEHPKLKYQYCKKKKKTTEYLVIFMKKLKAFKYFQVGNFLHDHTID